MALLESFLKGTAERSARSGARLLNIGEKMLSHRSTRALVIGGAFAAGIAHQDPIGAAAASFEKNVMGDENFSKRILGRQMGGMGLISTIAPMPGIGRDLLQGDYMGVELFKNASMQRSISSGFGADGSMVFGMHNSRMG